MKASKAIAIIGSSIGLAGAVSMATCAVLADKGIVNFDTGLVRSYHGEFYVDDLLLSETTGKRGTEITAPESPSKAGDQDGNCYAFLGWDTTGTGIPSVAPSRLYYNFKAKAVFLKYKINIPEDLLENLSADTIEKLLELLEKFNISLEDLLKFLGLSLDDIPKIPVFEFDMHNSYDGAIVFRTYSEGKWSEKSKGWIGSNYYNGATVGLGDYQPLNFVAEKIKLIQENTAMKALIKSYTKGKYNLDDYKFNFDFNYLRGFDYYPVPEYEVDNKRSAKSDCYALTSVVNNQYSTSGYFTVYEQTKDLFKYLSKIDFTEDIAAKEVKYRSYVNSNYLEIPSSYRDLLTADLAAAGLSYNRAEPDYEILSEVPAFISSNCSTTDTTGKNPKDPIIKACETKHGSINDLTSYQVFLYRALGIPARLAHGYVCLAEGGKGVGYMGADLVSSCAEVYIDNLGWVVMDPLDIKTSEADQKTDIGKDHDDNIDRMKEYGKGLSAGDISSGLLSVGPGESGPAAPTGDALAVAKFKSDYNGTVYFRSYAYENYTGEGWTNDAEGYSETTAVSPLDFTRATATNAGRFPTNTFEIETLTDFEHPIAPEYSSTSASSDRGYYDAKLASGNISTYSSVMVPSDKISFNLLKTNSAFDSKDVADSKKKYQEYMTKNNKYATVDEDGLTGEYTTICSSTGLSSYRSSMYSDYEKLVAIKNYLATNYTYDINFSAYEGFDDNLEGFFYYRRGICQQFATFSTILARYLGFRARWVVGYCTRSIDGETCYINRDTAHAWTEVYINDVGWITWDCTPANFQYDRDVTKEQTEDDKNYGLGPGGGGVQNTPSYFKILPTITISKTYDSSYISPEDISDSDIELKTIKNCISRSDFDDMFTMSITNVYKSGTNELIYDYEAATNENLKADVVYKIYSKETGEDVTSLFNNYQDNPIDPNGTGAVVKNVKVNVIKRDLTVTTTSQEEAYVDLMGESLIAEIGQIKDVSTGLIVIDNYSIEATGDFIEVDQDSIASLSEEGNIEAYLLIKVYKVVSGSIVDVTDLYNIQYEYGELTVV